MSSNHKDSNGSSSGGNCDDSSSRLKQLNIARYDVDEKEMHELTQWNDLRTRICQETAVKSKQTHWLPRWRRGILRLLEQTKMGFFGGPSIFAVPTNHPAGSLAPVEPRAGSLYIVYFPLQNGKFFPLKIHFELRHPTVVVLNLTEYERAECVEYTEAVLNLRNRLYVEDSRNGRGIRDLPVNLWFSFLHIVYRELRSSFNYELCEKIEKLLITTDNWIRVPYTSYHLDVPLVIGGNLVKRSSRQSNVNNLSWVNHKMKISKPGDDDYDDYIGHHYLFNDREKCGIEIIDHGNMPSAFLTNHTLNLYREQVNHLLNLCFRHNRSKRELVCAFANQVFDEQAQLAQKPMPMNEEIDEGSVRYRVEEFLRPFMQPVQSPMQFWFCESNSSSSSSSLSTSPTSSSVNNAADAPVAADTYDVVRDIILLLSDAAYYKGLRRRSYYDEDEWLVAAVKVAKRVAEYKKYLTETTINLDYQLPDALSNIVGHYFLLYVQLPDPPHVVPAKITESEWRFVD